MLQLEVTFFNQAFVLVSMANFEMANLQCFCLALFGTRVGQYPGKSCSMQCGMTGLSMIGDFGWPLIPCAIFFRAAAENALDFYSQPMRHHVLTDIPQPIQPLLE
ncbi:MAG: hypothetical protein M8364_18960 [Methylobacter sp.]|uniref:hypothetical protein n=1 Tax=Methylobacter sp. TaxID=2051955 RepID=UPI002582BEC9|nr:hypothetical protein [Methylobacter sp.]MCL7422976.1 hypothetical protein [Methylobacter sp.]